MSYNFGPSLSYKIHRLNLLILYFIIHLSKPFKVYLIKLACLCQLHHIIQVVIHFKFYHLTSIMRTMVRIIDPHSISGHNLSIERLHNLDHASRCCIHIVGRADYRLYLQDVQNLTCLIKFQLSNMLLYISTTVIIIQLLCALITFISHVRTH